MISKQQIKFIKSLDIKKFRLQHQMFLVQGEKSLLEIANSKFEVDQYFLTDSFIQKHTKLFSEFSNVVEASEKEIKTAGTFNSNNAGIATVKMRNPIFNRDQFFVALDNIQDPGNLGTIIRTCDWYGINQVVCNENCVDLYNPKVISSTMGSFTRVDVHYKDLKTILSDIKVASADLNGTSVHDYDFAGIQSILLGNESHGISSELEPLISEKITIPKYGNAESLNVSMAAGIILDRFASRN